MTKEEILSLYKDGWTIGSHSATHGNFYTLQEKEIIQEVCNSKKDLEKEMGMQIDYFAYPKGGYTQRVLQAVSDTGYKLALSMNNGFVSQETDRTLLPRIGVDRTYNFLEFKSLYTPSAVWLRSIWSKYAGAMI